MPATRRPTLSESMGAGFAPGMNSARGQTIGEMQMNGPQPQPSAAPAAVPDLTPPSGRNSRLAEMLMAQAVGAKPQGWGDLLNAFGSMAMAKGLEDRSDKERKGYSSKLAAALSGATDPDAMSRVLVSSGDPDLIKAGISAKIAQTKVAEPTGDMREYAFAMKQREAAGQPSIPFDQYQTGLKSAGASRVNVDTKQESEYEKTRGAELGKTFGQIMTEAQASTSRIGQLKSLDALLSDPNVYTGTGAETVNTLKRAGKSLLGMDIEGVGSADAARRLTTEMALSLKSDLPGPMSNADREFLQSIPPNIGDTAEGRKLVVNLMVAKEQRKLEMGKLARDYRAKNSGRLDDGWYDTLAAYNEANPLVTPEMMQAAQATARSAPQPRPTTGVPQHFRTKWGLE